MKRPPNIVFILCDDLGINDLHCYGREDHHTPNLDRLARQGMRFTSAYASQAICSASRAGLLTGLNPARLHLTTFLPGRRNAVSQRVLHPEIAMNIPLSIKTFPRYFKETGHTTGLVGKWHVGQDPGPSEHGFDFVYYHGEGKETIPSASEGGKAEYELTREALGFVETHQNEPFALCLTHYTPHIPYSARPELVEKHRDAFEPVYAALIETLDDTIGMILDKLDELDLTRNTIVVFTSDNGGLHVPELNHDRVTHNTPFRAGKGYVYEGGQRVPLIVRWPGQVPAGAVTHAPVNNIDWIPTLLELVGAPPPAGLDGVSVAGGLLGGVFPEHPHFWHFPHYTNQGGRPSGAMREGDWLLVEHYDEDAVELYNLAEDVGEHRDLATAHPDRVRQMRAALDAWRREIGAQTNTPNPDCREAAFRALYVDVDPSRFDPLLADEKDWRTLRNWRQEMDERVKKTTTPSRRDRIEGCWAGKCLAGAIGMPFEGVPHAPNLREEQIHVQNVPNDDLELQLVWLLAMERHGLRLRAEHLVKPWVDDIRHGCDEYSIALRNLRHGVMPPQSGCADNPFVDGMGAAIRSEIWAALFPGRPDAAAFFASQDAVVDHWGDGVWAEVFLASAESLMFAGAAVGSALRQALDAIPASTRLRPALEGVFALREQGLDADGAKARLVPMVHSPNFTDCVMNLAFIVFALLWGEGDFIRTVLLAVNCGRDTDCTAATVGAILGITQGMRGIPADLLDRLSPRLSLGEQIGRIAGVPGTLVELADRTEALRERLAAEIPGEPYPAYVPCPHVPPAGHDRARWLVLDDPDCDGAAIREELLRTGVCPERYNHRVVTTEGLTLDLSAFAHAANTLNLFTFLTVKNEVVDPGSVVVSATADVGMTLWFDRTRLMNHHSRQLAIPSFHRAEGGAAFHYPLQAGDRRLVHIKLYSCLPPLRCTLMFGDVKNDPLDGFNLDIG